MYLGLVVILGIVLILLLTRSHRKAIPGYAPSDKELGNFPDVGRAGSFHEFLCKSHKRFGPVFEFWWGKQRTVSLCDIEMFKAIKHLPDRPPLSFENFIPLIGKQSIQLINGEEYLRRREKLHKPILNIHAIHQNLVPKLNELMHTEVLPYFEAVADTPQVLKLDEVCYKYTVQGVAYLVLGTQADISEVRTIIESYPIVIDALMAKVSGKQFTQEDQDEFERQLGRMKAVIRTLMAHKPTGATTLLGQYAAESEDVVMDDMISFMVGGFHTSNFLLQWSMFLAAKHPEEQEKLYREVMTHSSEPHLSSKVESMPRLRNFVDEVIRWAELALFASRVSDKDVTLPGGYVIPRGTMIFLALANILIDDKLWDRPSEFIPDRFNDPEARGFKFCGFGFAGGRSCPGRVMAYTEIKIFLAEVIKRYAFILPSADYDVSKKYAFVSEPNPSPQVLVRRR
jgi:cytochrome P450 family 20 subfamily A